MSSRGEQPQKLVFCMGGVDFRSTICQFYEAFLRVRVLEHRFCEAFLLHCSTTHQFYEAFLKVCVLDVQPFHRFRYIVSRNSWKRLGFLTEITIFIGNNDENMRFGSSHLLASRGRTFGAAPEP